MVSTRTWKKGRLYILFRCASKCASFDFLNSYYHLPTDDFVRLFVYITLNCRGLLDSVYCIDVDQISIIGKLKCEIFLTNIYFTFISVIGL
jgi:hypothetical protein